MEEEQLYDLDGGSDPGDVICLEFCYEVIHKVGGIETVVRTKAPAMVNEYGDNYFMVGPHLSWDDKFVTNFEEAERNEESEILYKLIDSFEARYGITGVKYGRWLTAGNPQVFLLPMIYNSGTHFEHKIDHARNILRTACNLEIPSPGFGEREPYIWNAFLFGVVGWCFVSHAMSFLFTDVNVIMHSHEWIGCVSQVLYSRNGNCETGQREDHIHFLFTTHATTLGRHLSAGNICLMDCLQVLKEKTADQCASHWDMEASRRKIAIEHRIERAAAHTADVFTTVSEITGREAECFLGKAPDVITYNGMDVDSARSVGSDIGANHNYYHGKILDFCRGHFYGTTFNPEKTIIIFSAGRLEYKNKGYDMFLDALHSLNERFFRDPLLEDYKDITVVGIIIAPSQVSQYQVDTLKGVSLMQEIKDCTRLLADKISTNLVNLLTNTTLSQNLGSLTLGDILSKNDIVLMKRCQQSYTSRSNLPSILTHTLRDPSLQDATEPILVRMRELGLVNQKESRVKVVWIPEFVSKTSPVGLDYNEFTLGGSLGVFCSLYEPWGYTSPECCCAGTPSIVSNLCGFGSFIESMVSRDTFKNRSKSVIEQSERLHHVASLTSISHMNSKKYPRSGGVSDYGNSPGDSGSPLSSSGTTTPELRSKAVSNRILHQKSIEHIISEHDKNSWNISKFGVQVVDRVYIDYHESVDRLTNMLVDFVRLSPIEYVNLRHKTERASVLCDWSAMISRYNEAHKLAIMRRKKCLAD